MKSLYVVLSFAGVCALLGALAGGVIGALIGAFIGFIIGSAMTIKPKTE